MKREYAGIAKGIMAELTGDQPAVDLRVATYSLFGMMNWIYNWYRPGRDAPLERLIRDMTRIFLTGFLAGGPQGAVAGLGTASGLQD